MRNLPSGFNPVRHLHVEIQHDHIGSKPGRFQDGVLPVFCFADYVNISRRLQERLKSGSSNRVIINQQQPYGLHILLGASPCAIST